MPLPDTAVSCAFEGSASKRVAGHAVFRPVPHADLSGVVVIIPALNEERSLPLVLGDLPEVGLVIVVDNGSSDRTAIVARRGGAVVVAEPMRGYGSACLAGLAEVKHRVRIGVAPPDAVVFLDADYSDSPDLLPLLAGPIMQGRADMVLGSRLQGDRERGAMPPQSVYGNRFACFLMRLLFRARYTDLGPFRAISWSALRRLKMQDRNYGWTVKCRSRRSVPGYVSSRFPCPTGGAWERAKSAVPCPAPSRREQRFCT